MIIMNSLEENIKKIPNNFFEKLNRKIIIPKVNNNQINNSNNDKKDNKIQIRSKINKINNLKNSEFSGGVIGSIRNNRKNQLIISPIYNQTNLKNYKNFNNLYDKYVKNSSIKEERSSKKYKDFMVKFYINYLFSAIFAFKCQRCSSNNIFLINDFIHQLYDIITYMRMVKEVNLMKNILFREEELKFIESKKNKINLYSETEVFNKIKEDINNDKFNTINYFLNQNNSY